MGPGPKRLAQAAGPDLGVSITKDGARTAARLNRGNRPKREHQSQNAVVLCLILVRKVPLKRRFHCYLVNLLWRGPCSHAS